MATDPTTIPSVADLQETKQYMNNINEFVSSENNTLVDRDGKTRRTLVGVNDAFDSMQSGQLTAQAVDAADRAEVAADAAALSGNVFTNTSDGITSGLLYFSIISPDEGYLDLYKNDNGTAVFQKQYPSTETIDNALSDLSEKVDSIPAKTDKLEQDLEVFTDEFGAIIRRTDPSAEQYLPSMDNRSVQDIHREQKDTAYEGGGFRSKDIFQVEDSSGNVTMRQDVTGGVYMPGLNGSVQAVTGQTVDKTVYFPTDDREKLHSTVKPLIQDLVVDGRPYIDPPTSLVPNNFSVPNSFVNAFTTQPENGMWLETPHHQGGLVHPFLLTMRKPLQGYKYWFADTPHISGAKEENPCIWGTNSLDVDNRRFDLIPNLSQPLDRPLMVGDVWNADEGFAYDARSGKFIMYWLSGGVGVSYRESWNGIDWNEKKIIQSLTGIPSGFLSPAILYNTIDSKWHAWAVGAEGVIRHYTSDEIDGLWVEVSVWNINNLLGIKAWHLEVKFIGEKYVMMINQRKTGEDVQSNLWFAVSSDGDNWTVGSAILPTDTVTYKGTFEPEWDGNNLRFWIGWNAYSFPRLEGVEQYLYINPTNWVDVTTL